MPHSMLRVVHVKWTDRPEGAPPAWEELEDKLRSNEVMTLEGLLTIEQPGPEGSEVHVIAIGQQSF